MRIQELKIESSVILRPQAPYNFDACFHKPSHFPSSDNVWEKGSYWITMLWEQEVLGLKFENKGSVSAPAVKVGVYSKKKLSKEFMDRLILELRWRFNFDSDISEFNKRLKDDAVLGTAIKKWRGTKPVVANSLYETLIIYLVLQNAAVRRSVQMLENLFTKFGKKVRFDGKVLSTFWEPERIAQSSEQVLRDFKVGYRAKFFMRISEQFVHGEIDEFELRHASSNNIKETILKLYGIGPASVEYLLFEDFYCYDVLQTIPPWEQKILSRLLFDKPSVPVKKILHFFGAFKPWQKLAFHYLWEDLFWRRTREHIPWLEKEIRL